MTNWQILKYCFFLFLGWRVALAFITFFGLSTFPHMIGDGVIAWPNPNLDYWIRWANWDGGHFRGIAENGYLPIQTVFFPGYPILITILQSFGIHSLWGGLIISNLATIFVLFFLFKIILLDFDEQIAKRAIFALLIFPTSFYLGAVYSEALFLLCALGAFYFARKHNWLLTSVFTAAAVSTRLVGIVLVLAILFDYLLKDNPKFSLNSLINTILKRLLLITILLNILNYLFLNLSIQLKNFFLSGFLSSLAELIFWTFILIFFLTILEFILKNINFKKIITKPTFILLLSILPLFLYMYFQKVMYNSPFTFLTNEYLWHRSETLPWEPVIGYFTHLKAVNFLQIGNPARTLTEFLFFIISLVGLIFSLYKLRASYTLFFLLAFITPLFSGTLIAIQRYILVIFPLFILFALIKNEYLQKSLIFFSGFLLAIYAVLFIGSFWVT